MADRDALDMSPSLVNSAVEAMLTVLWEDAVDNPRGADVEVGERSSCLESAMMARVNRDSRRGCEGAAALLYRASR